MPGKVALLAGCTAALFGGLTTVASADHHEMVISEVYPGTDANLDSAFVELQMYSSGQQFVGGHQVISYNAGGTETLTVTLPGDVASGQNQRTILIGDLFGNGGSPGDFYGNWGAHIFREGGAVCFISTGGFGPIDCVSWGNFVGSVPSPTGTVAAPGGIPDDSSLTRNITRRCPTFLEAADDTDNSAADFTVTATETPQTNSDPVATTKCPNTRFTKTPPKKTTRRRATFKFKAVPAAPSFKCKLDDKPFKPCTSPFRKRVKPGKHKFKVLAENEVSPEGYRWKVVRD